VEYSLILIALLPALSGVIDGLGTDLLVVLLERGEILSGLAELALLHSLADIPVDEGALGVHQIELVVDAAEDLGDGGRVGDHADGALDLGEIAARDDGRRLVVDAALKRKRKKRQGKGRDRGQNKGHQEKVRDVRRRRKTKGKQEESVRALVKLFVLFLF
jgi:hypothetical protein